MSFILNALKKSEQERYAKHSETLESRVLEIPENSHSNMMNEEVVKTSSLETENIVEDSLTSQKDED